MPLLKQVNVKHVRRSQVSNVSVEIIGLTLLTMASLWIGSFIAKWIGVYIGHRKTTKGKVKTETENRLAELEFIAAHPLDNWCELCGAMFKPRIRLGVYGLDNDHEIKNCKRCDKDAEEIKNKEEAKKEAIRIAGMFPKMVKECHQKMMDDMKA
jgi:hypothetical protein